jgi:chromosome segregation ATPase
VYGQSNVRSNDATALQALVDEVRLLRQAVQKASLYAQRGELIVQRVRIQQDRIDRLSRRLESVRTEIHDLELQDSGLEEHIKELSERAAQADTSRRGEIDTEAKSVKQTLFIQRQREDELRRQESQLSTTLTEEQAKSDDFEKRLDTLAGELDRALQPTRE